LYLSSISWDKLIKSLKLRENHRGRSSQFRPQGKLALKIPTPRTKYLEQKEKYFALHAHAQETLEADLKNRRTKEAIFNGWIESNQHAD